MKYTKENVNMPALGMLVFHEKIYDGKEQMKVVGIRATEVELEGDYSGGTHNVCQKSWMPIDGTIRYKKVCSRVEEIGRCDLHNLHCNFPNCEPYIHPLTIPNSNSKHNS